MNGLTASETSLIAMALEDWGYDHVEQWACDSGYLRLPSGVWVDDEGNPTDIYMVMLAVIRG